MTSSTENIDLESYGTAAGGALLTEFSWHNLVVTVKEHKTKQLINILEGVTGCARPGSWSARCSSLLALRRF